jgi:PhnB protein
MVRIPPNGEWVAIRFRLGVYFPGLATRRLLDRQDLNLPVRGDDSFWLADSFWNCRISRPPRQGRCEEAIDFYRDAVDADATVVARVGDLPGPPAPPGAGNKVAHAVLRIGDTVVLASDGQGNGQPAFNGFSLSLTASDDTQAERLFAALADGGQIQVPMASTPFASRLGILTDRFGVPWLVVTDAQTT